MSKERVEATLLGAVAWSVTFASASCATIGAKSPQCIRTHSVEYIARAAEVLRR